MGARAFCDRSTGARYISMLTSCERKKKKHRRAGANDKMSLEKLIEVQSSHNVRRKFAYLQTWYMIPTKGGVNQATSRSAELHGGGRFLGRPVKLETGPMKGKRLGV